MKIFYVIAFAVLGLVLLGEFRLGISHVVTEDVDLLTLLNVFAVAPLPQAQAPVKEVGPAVGSSIPAFTAVDQFGHKQTLRTLMGPKGLVLLFVRSADW